MQLVNDLKQRQSLFESALMQKEMEKVMLYQVCLSDSRSPDLGGVAISYERGTPVPPPGKVSAPLGGWP